MASCSTSSVPGSRTQQCSRKFSWKTRRSSTSSARRAVVVGVWVVDERGHASSQLVENALGSRDGYALKGGLCLSRNVGREQHVAQAAQRTVGIEWLALI